VRDCRLPPRRTCDLRFSGILRITDVSGNRIGPIFKGHAAQKVTAWPLKIEPQTRPETSVRNYESPLRKVPKYGSSQCQGVLLLQKRKFLLMKHFHGKSVPNFQPDQTTRCIRISQNAFLPLFFAFSRLDCNRCQTVRNNMCCQYFKNTPGKKTIILVCLWDCPYNCKQHDTECVSDKKKYFLWQLTESVNFLTRDFNELQCKTVSLVLV